MINYRVSDYNIVTINILQKVNSMNTIKFTGWKKGARKISFIELLKEKGDMQLTEAKLVKDRIVNNDEVVEIVINDEQNAKIIIKQANALGFTTS